MIVGLVMILLGIANVVLLVLVLRELRRRSPGQLVAGSRPGQSVAAIAPAGAPVAGSTPARALMTKDEQEAYDAVELNRITAQLAKDYPSIGASKREAAAKEILQKARGLLARTP